MPDILVVLFMVAVLPVFLSAVGVCLRISEFGKLDNHHPREQQARLTGIGARAVAAQNNAWEALLLLGVVVIIAVAAKVDLHSLSSASYLFLVSRMLHPVFYMANMALLRSTAFGVGWFTCVYIFYVSCKAF
ncbi:MAPEG family protein [Oceanisphaera psychrotolerans]|uniref:MAPEG family protein n=1 Tax=Oceanisphaera psychrotolerans TaxID=1414654 RepID=A0A1J4QCW2_9GAMM|nr:MAPEG family protein [Oceanisphaera psychrotolerans]OIN04476.1 hypothetical protein BFR47_06140 [Oceanisphaera psychrotolerans]